MNKIIIFGASGMAGHVIYSYLQENSKFKIVGTTHSTFFNDNCFNIDIFNSQKVEDFILNEQPCLVINCIGSLIKESKTYPDRAIYCNAYFPHFLKKCANKAGAKLIHLSTDCVFSGKSGSYHEDSYKDASDLYGLSKSLGEIDDETNLTIRTSIIGPEIKKNGEGLFHWFMNQQKDINGYKSNYWSGITTVELAKFILWEIENPQTGLIQLTNGQAISKFDLLQATSNIYNKKINIHSDKDYICDKSLIKSERVLYQVPDYNTMLLEQKLFMQHHKQFYTHYEF